MNEWSLTYVGPNPEHRAPVTARTPSGIIRATLAPSEKFCTVSLMHKDATAFAGVLDKRHSP